MVLEGPIDGKKGVAASSSASPRGGDTLNGPRRDMTNVDEPGMGAGRRAMPDQGASPGKPRWRRNRTTTWESQEKKRRAEVVAGKYFLRKSREVLRIPR